MQKKEWARWRPQDASELIGDEVAFTYDLIEEAISTEGGERCFLLHGNPGRGKGCISGLIQDKFMPNAPDAVRRSYVHKGKLVTLSVAKEIMEEAAYASAYGKWRVLVINEVDEANKDIQTVLHDWLQDDLPRDYVVIVTTNRKPITQEHLTHLLESKQIGKAEAEDNYLQPRFASRFTWEEISTLNTDELANEITRVTGIPIAIAKVCASNSQGDIRHALKEVQSCITANRVRKKQQRERELIHE
jgi:replication-associated recombination protein RarA